MPRVPGFALRFNARSGAAGENVKGTVTTIQKSGSRSVATVSCLKATGGRAIVGVVTSGSSVLFDVETGRESVGAAVVASPPSCSSPGPLNQHPGEGSPVVHDAL